MMMDDLLPSAHALAPGSRLADAAEISGGGGQAPSALIYEGRSLADATPVEIVECWPAGSLRGEGGQCLPGPEQDATLKKTQSAFAERLAALENLAAQGLVRAFGRIEANQTLYAVTPVDETPTLDNWGTDLLRRATPDELARIIQRLVERLQAAHQAGVCHGAISQATIRLDTPDDAHLAGFLIPPAAGATEQTDVMALAAAIYVVVTGRPPPQPQEGFLPDPRHAASHIAADDYPPALLVAIDDALGLGGPPKPQDPKAWLAKLRAAATDPAAAPVLKPAAAPEKAGGAARTERAASKTAPAQLASNAGETLKPPGQIHLPQIAAAVLLLAAAGIGSWVLLPRNSGEPVYEAKIAAATPAPEQPVAPPPPVAAQPSSAMSTPVVAPAPTAAVAVIAPPAAPIQPEAPVPAPVAPVTDFQARIAAAGDRESLLALQASGADPKSVASRLQELGYVSLVVAGERRWLKAGAAEVFRDCTNCPELVVAPAGQVQMTLAIGPALRTFSVPVPGAFAVGRHEVTRAQFAAFISSSGYVPVRGCHARTPDWQLNPSLSWENPGFAQTQDHPAVCISAEDARAYLAWLSARSGQRYRLPTDAEWHYVALRQAAGAAQPESLCGIGNGADETAREANPGWAAAPCRDGYVHTAPVGRFAAIDWGLTDISGNVWEWVDTCPPSPTDTVFPPPNCPPEAPRILRGGSFSDPPSMRLLDARIVSQPEIRDQIAGFRVLREITASE
ncbi:SUMF1/EgtB/PvdO family nonheme iron enzyme [Bosea sp. AAP35]|uniref:SUMF1/EgtB/PvdO family nonheme iron enzyme n=1 Tax=Bosea sp. AAP35 TaxID=1523417 RepID=UPI0006B88DC1|nr:SUMF1/EgtB/PvdO family nonheme iron enzyme [Bosea sp. AAP35]